MLSPHSFIPLYSIVIPVLAVPSPPNPVLCRITRRDEATAVRLNVHVVKLMANAPSPPTSLLIDLFILNSILFSILTPKMLETASFTPVLTAISKAVHRCSYVMSELNGMMPKAPSPTFAQESSSADLSAHFDTVKSVCESGWDA